MLKAFSFLHNGEHSLWVLAEKNASNFKEKNLIIEIVIAKIEFTEDSKMDLARRNDPAISNFHYSRTRVQKVKKTRTC